MVSRYKASYVTDRLFTKLVKSQFFNLYKLLFNYSLETKFLGLFLIII